jgi:hypothetical protein
MGEGDLALAAAKSAKLKPSAYRFEKKIGGVKMGVVMASGSSLPKPAMEDVLGPTPSLLPKGAMTPAPVSPPPSLSAASPLISNGV